MLALAGEGAAEGLWLRAERQTGGRGRMGRNWESPDGNLHCSTLVRLKPDDPPPATLALVAAVAVWQALDALLPGRVNIKWPNDLIIGAAKLSGMLLERSRDAVVIGIGVNVMAQPDIPDRPTTSLWAQGAVDATPGVLLENIAACFRDGVSSWRTYGLAPIQARWLAAAHPAGTPLRASLPDGTVVEGRFSTLDEQGALILDLADGGTRAIHAGDVFLA
jgi:BirA family biotin operon repressor/biotin-[acetyl-CoA-carboxylase] ligase